MTLDGKYSAAGVGMVGALGRSSSPSGDAAGPLAVRPIGKDEFHAHVKAAAVVSYQQTPEWSAVRSGRWDSELVGWFDTAGLRVGVSVIRYQTLPVIGSRIAYIPLGPVIDWGQVPIEEVLAGLRRYLQDKGVFVIRMYPLLPRRTWRSGTVRRALADPDLRHLAEVEPDALDPVACDLVGALCAGGWRELGGDEAVESTQPRFTYRVPLAGRTADDVFAGFTKVWRKNIRSAARQGLEVCPAAREDLRDVQRLHEETAARNGFAAQPSSYVESLWDRFTDSGPCSLDVDLGRHDGEVLSGNIAVNVGDVAYAIIAGNSVHQRELRASNAVYWAQIQRSIFRGATAYDLGAVTPVLDDDHPQAGLLTFKLGLGGEVVEGVGGWDLPLSPVLHAAFTRLYPLYSSTSAAVKRLLSGWRVTAAG